MPLRLSQVETLRLIEADEPTMGDVAARRGVAEATAKRQLAELVRDGLAERYVFRPDVPGATARYRYRLTQLGREALEGSDGR